MKKFKKFFGIACLSLIVTLPFGAKCCATGSKRVPVTLASTKQTVRLLNNKKLGQKIEEINTHLNKKYNVEIIDGGSYYNTARADGYEVHHLISAHFCRNHPDVLSISRSPAVLIPKKVHRLTGSHIGSGYTNMIHYLSKEEKNYQKYQSIHALTALGIRDLILAFKKYDFIKGQLKNRRVHSSDIVTQTPIKRIFKHVQILSPCRPSLSASRFTTPQKPENPNSDNSKSQPFGKNFFHTYISPPCTPLKYEKRSRIANSLAACS